MNEEERRRKAAELEQLYKQSGVEQSEVRQSALKQPPSGVTQDISSLDRWGQESPDLLKGLSNPAYQPTPFDLALAAKWRQEDPELFNSLLPEAPQSAIAESPYLKPVLIGGGVLLVLVFGSIVVGGIQGVLGKAKAEPTQSAIAAASPVPSATPTATPSPVQSPPPFPEPVEFGTHKVIGRSGDCLNVRDHFGNVLGCIEVGRSVTVTAIEADGKWAVTEYMGKTAYLSIEHLAPNDLKQLPQ